MFCRGKEAELSSGLLFGIPSFRSPPCFPELRPNISPPRRLTYPAGFFQSPGTRRPSLPSLRTPFALPSSVSREYAERTFECEKDIRKLEDGTLCPLPECSAGGRSRTFFRTFVRQERQQLQSLLSAAPSPRRAVYCRACSRNAHDRASFKISSMQFTAL